MDVKGTMMSDNDYGKSLVQAYNYQCKCRKVRMMGRNARGGLLGDWRKGGKVRFGSVMLLLLLYCEFDTDSHSLSP